MKPVRFNLLNRKDVKMVLLFFSDQCFNDELSFLSNFYLSHIRVFNHGYKSAEHLYQTLKCANESDKKKIRKTETPRQAKILSKFIETRSDWNEEKKTEIMETVLKLKFKKRKLRNRLINTDDAELIYLNYWHDTFWGVCMCTTHNRTGQNQLGVLLMKLRSSEEELDLIQKFDRLSI